MHCQLHKPNFYTEIMYNIHTNIHAYTLVLHMACGCDQVAFAIVNYLTPENMCDRKLVRFGKFALISYRINK